MAEPFLLECDMSISGTNKQVLSSRKLQLKITKLMGKTELRLITQNHCNFITKTPTNTIKRPYKNTSTIKSPLEFVSSIILEFLPPRLYHLDYRFLQLTKLLMQRKCLHNSLCINCFTRELNIVEYETILKATYPTTIFTK